MKRVRWILSLLTGGSRAYGAKLRGRVLAARAAEIFWLFTEIPDDEHRPARIQAYIEIQKGTMSWAHQDLALAIADLFDPPSRETPK